MSDIEYLCPVVPIAYNVGNSDVGSVWNEMSDNREAPNMPNVEQLRPECLPYRAIDAVHDGLRKSSYVKPPSPFPQIDWKETRDAHIFNVDIPGVKKEAVKVRMAENGIVEISVERRKEEESGDEEEKYHCFERFKGSFARRFRVSEDAKVDEAKASIEGGVLTVIVPKQHDYQPKFKDIEIYYY